MSRHLWSWLPRAHPMVGTLNPGAGGTEFFFIDIPDTFFAVRIVTMNVMAAPWNIRAMAVCASAGDHFVTPQFSDGSPRPASDWRAVTWQWHGADVLEFPGSSAPASFEVPQAYFADPATGLAQHPEWQCSDWVPLLGSARNPVTGRVRLMVRTFVDGGVSMPFNALSYHSGQWTGSADRHFGYESWFGGAKGGVDYVTNPNGANGLDPATLTANRIRAGVIGPVMVQAMTSAPSTTILASGDSIWANVPDGAAIRGAMMANEPARPVGFVSGAQSRQGSVAIYRRLGDLASIVRPAITLLPCWTPNDLTVMDMSGNAASAVCGTLFRHAVDASRGSGAIPIAVGPWPNDTLNADDEACWRMAYETMEGARYRSVAVDPAGILHGGAQGIADPRYPAGMTTDGVHPTVAAQHMVAPFIRDAIRGFIV